MKVHWMKLVSSAAVIVGLSGCVSYGNTHALITPVAGYHTFKPEHAPTPREINLRDPNRIAAAKDKQEPAADTET